MPSRPVRAGEPAAPADAAPAAPGANGEVGPAGPAVAVPGPVAVGGSVPDRGGVPGNVAPVAYAHRVTPLRARERPKRPLRPRRAPAHRRVDTAYAPARTADYAPPWYEL
ncbi:hypothetical protein GCM10018772_52980 [Streptomyces fumanus]|uniref:Uncharacterized protein n=1 Tax=Streptomyces fumanus TaxID=67302 RepID=A0A919ASQ3_9ACTN|nr:hypothetical protein GCM10018772_52980 [Streptomyces fumanus]